MKFAEMQPPTPVFHELAAEYNALFAKLSEAQSRAERLAVVKAWDGLRRTYATWEAVVYVHFEQDTQNADYKQARDYADELRPKLAELDTAMMRRLLAAEHRGDVEAAFGTTCTALWEAEVLTYDPQIEAETVAEAKLGSQYTELCAAARLPMRGELYTLSTITKFSQDPQRDLRHEAEAAQWNWFADNGEKLDTIFDRLVQLRTLMAKKLGFPSFVELAYKRMKRVDYNREHVEFYRAQVREHVVPLCTAIHEEQRKTLGLEKLFAYDEALFDPQGNPKPQGDHDWMVDQAIAMFDEIGSGLGEFFRLLVDRGLTDLKSRDGKAPGGFCSGFPDYGVPFIFANFNGTKGDVEVFTHEMGHAFQAYESRHLPLFDYLWPTYESCEIHSMSLEFLTWPHMEKFFGDGGGERFRRMHLTKALLFLPYGVAVDHFQHLVYERPEATPSERHAMWQDVERMYMPQRDWDDLAYPAQGGRWQSQRHIYLSPFYYIDYTLAQCCALQFWVRAKQNFARAMHDYVALCQRGGEAPFQQLAKSAGLKSPFEPGALVDVVDQARKVLAL
jgi:M3 family oligoendopeptidase